jgi:hypothetical protein
MTSPLLLVTSAQFIIKRAYTFFSLIISPLNIKKINYWKNCGRKILPVNYVPHQI